MKTSIRLSFLLAMLLAVVPNAWAEVRLAGIFTDHMILQRERPIQVWGWADKGEELTVEFAGQTAKATGGDDGAWSVTLKPLAASAEGRELRVKNASRTFAIRDVVVGEVWHASGQSNMAMTVGAMAKELNPVKTTSPPRTCRRFAFAGSMKRESPHPLDDLRTEATWTLCSPATVADFSGVAFYFARQLHTELDVPVGIIDSSRGGTPIEPFIPREAFGLIPRFAASWSWATRTTSMVSGSCRAAYEQGMPTGFLDGCLTPAWLRFPGSPSAARSGIRANRTAATGEDPRDYQHKMRALITGWRRAFGNEQMPIYFVQLPGSGAGNGWPYLREQQRLAADMPHTGMVVTVDIDGAGIHPPNKIDVGHRLALWALAKRLSASRSPLAGRCSSGRRFKETRSSLHFRYADSGLMVATKDGLAAPRETPDAELAHFELVGKDGVWWPADAQIDGKTVVVTERKGSIPRRRARMPTQVTPENCNLYSRDGLPASPFCSDPPLLQYDPGLPK